MTEQVYVGFLNFVQEIVQIITHCFICHFRYVLAVTMIAHVNSVDLYKT